VRWSADPRLPTNSPVFAQKWRVARFAPNLVLGDSGKEAQVVPGASPRLPAKVPRMSPNGSGFDQTPTPAIKRPVPKPGTAPLIPEVAISLRRLFIFFFLRRKVVEVRGLDVVLTINRPDAGKGRGPPNSPPVRGLSRDVCGMYRGPPRLCHTKTQKSAQNSHTFALKKSQSLWYNGQSTRTLSQDYLHARVPLQLRRQVHKSP
jgi:hypothetical protein